MKAVRRKARPKPLPTRLRYRRRPLASMAVAFSVLLATSISAYSVLWALDFGGLGLEQGLAIFGQPRVAEVMASLSEVTVAMLGVSLTVVAIIVQLASTRYTSQITELFVRDPVNSIVMGFFSLTAVLIFWVQMSLGGETHPRTMALVAMGLMSLSLLALLPYFVYVLQFISPERVLEHFERRGLNALDLVGRRGEAEVLEAHRQVRFDIDQLGGMLVHCIDNKDRALVVSALSSLSSFANVVLSRKSTLPKEWFRCEQLPTHDHDFAAFQPAMLQDIEEKRTWVEMKILSQFLVGFKSSSESMPAINHLTAIHTRYVGQQAIQVGDLAVLGLTIRFLNTYLRIAINARQVRCAYNVLNEYRELSLPLMGGENQATVVELYGHVKFYALLAFERSLHFVVETAAYDLCGLVERSLTLDLDIHDPLCDLLLELDQIPGDDRGQELALIGVLKAQAKLATFYLVNDREDLARKVYEDMSGKSPARLRLVWNDLASQTDSVYWEITDRGTNFSYLEEERRSQLNKFFGWFRNL